MGYVSFYGFGPSCVVSCNFHFSATCSVQNKKSFNFELLCVKYFMDFDTKCEICSAFAVLNL